MKTLVILGLLLSTTMAEALSVPPPQVLPKQGEEPWGMEAIKLHGIIGPGEHPSIPKTWRMVGVSPGEKPNSNNLWFQDSDGTVYLLRGVVSQNRLLLNEQVMAIPTK